MGYDALKAKGHATGTEPLREPMISTTNPLCYCRRELGYKFY